MPLSYCARLVRDHDYNRYLCTLFTPAHNREAWFTLFAFNHEIAVIGETVSEEMVGFVRFAWWRDALDKIYATQLAPKHPVAEALARVIYAYRLPRGPFDILLAARTQDVQQEQFATFADLTAYCRETSGALLRLCAIAANLPVSPALDDLGIAWALIGMARAQSQTDGISTAELINAARQHLETARTEKKGTMKSFAAFIHTCEFYLQRLTRNKEYKSRPTERLKLIVTLSLRSLI